MCERLTTSIEIDGDRARFVTATRDAVIAGALAALGYLRIGAGRAATRWFPRCPRVESYYARFAACIEGMVDQKLGRARAPWDRALLEFLRRVDGAALSWWLYGSVALAVRGLPIEPRDIDVHVDDAALAGCILDDLLVTPVERIEGWVAQYTARGFEHAIIEWLAEPWADHDDPAAPHEQGPFIAAHIEEICWRGHLVRVPPLSAQLRICERRGLTRRAELIRSALSRG